MGPTSNENNPNAAQHTPQHSKRACLEWVPDDHTSCVLLFEVSSQFTCLLFLSSLPNTFSRFRRGVGIKCTRLSYPKFWIFACASSPQSPPGAPGLWSLLLWLLMGQFQTDKWLLWESRVPTPRSSCHLYSQNLYNIFFWTFGLIGPKPIEHCMNWMLRAEKHTHLMPRKKQQQQNSHEWLTIHGIFTVRV